MKQLLSLTFLLLVMQISSATDLKIVPPESVGMSSERLARIQPFMQQLIDTGQLAGVVTLVARKGKIVHFEKTGKLNIETGEDLQRDSLFRIYSMSKPIVSVALMQLYEEGRFQLTDPVSKYLPAFIGTKVLVNEEEVDQEHEFTIQNLLSHTAGFTYGFFSNTEVDKMYRDKKILGNRNLKEMVERLGKIPLRYQPGTEWVYSVSADVAGHLVEVLSGQPLDEYLDNLIFKPLGMDDTFFQVPREKITRFGTNHSKDKTTGLLKVVDRPEDSAFTQKVTFFSGGGGLVSTAMDYLKFSQMLLDGGIHDGARILSPRTIELMTRNQLPKGVASGFGERPGVVSRFGFGFGFGVRTDAPLKSVGSKGTYNWGGMAGTVFWVDPEQELTAVLMVQMMRNPVPLRSHFQTLVYSSMTE
jgi:CubicO group peptidase (beta-lactamase class C family)